jgi:hypothetical protein
MPVEAAWAYSPVIAVENTRQATSFLYGITMPPLMPGTRYAWAVRAIAYDGSDELRIFENNGLSEIREFKIEDWCPQEIIVLNESVGNGKLIDYKYEAYKILDGILPNDLILIDGILYNANEAGNYIWGMILTYHGIFLSPNIIAELGTRGRKDETWEQRAITAGTNKSNKYVNLSNDIKEEILSYRLYFRKLYEGKDKSWRKLDLDKL